MEVVTAPSLAVPCLGGHSPALGAPAVPRDAPWESSRRRFNSVHVFQHKPHPSVGVSGAAQTCFVSCLEGIKIFILVFPECHQAQQSCAVDVTVPKSSLVFFLSDEKCNGIKKDLYEYNLILYLQLRLSGQCLGSPVYHLQRAKQTPTSHRFLFRECSYRNFWLCFDEGHKVMTCKSETMYLSFSVLILLIKNSILIYCSMADQHSLSCVDAFKTSVLSWHWMW